MQPLRFTCLLIALMAGVTASALGADGERWTLWAGPSFGQPILGSEDTRRGGFYALEYARPEKRLTFKGHKGELAWQGYYQLTIGGGFEDEPKSTLHQFGVLAVARYWRRLPETPPAYVEFGLGLQLGNRTTRDLDSTLLSTPMVGVGLQADLFGHPLLLGLRFFHSSNAGLRGDNQGMNQLQFLVGYPIDP